MRLTSIAPALCFLALPALAGPATSDGAAAIEAALGHYLGQAGGLVRVVPEGESYTLTLDLQPLSDMARDAGATLAISPLHLTLTEAEPGLWRVEENEQLAVLFELPGKISYDIRVGSARLDGTFDTALKAFRTVEGRSADISVALVDQLGPQFRQSVDYRVAQSGLSATAVAAAGGGIDLSVGQTATGITEKIAFEPLVGAEADPFELTLSVADLTTTGRITGLRNAAILELVAWVAAHGDRGAMQADLASLQPLLNAAMPFWNDATLSGEMDTVEVSSARGGGSAKRLTVELALAGAVQDWRLREALGITGLSLDVAEIPDWAGELLPRDAAVDFTLSGLDMAAAAGLAIGEVTPDGPAEGFEDRLGEALLADGRMRLALAPETRMTSATYSLDAEGAVEFGPGVGAEGRFTVSAEGIEAALDALEAAPESIRSGAVPGLMMLRGISRAAGVGRYQWDIEMVPPATVKVNGMDVSKFGRGLE
ncbi:MAG: hypothetical protein H6895_13505 [Defluviimonas sp.]|uniref:hypothetical protein n=1 Tax=Albidovulum sp. TaxID=1872424 RepID=UPI001D8C5EBF|nr:hypothetical protein [Paracoccaceae bacterium]MCC0065078.1 hypothetical protein [Defluviimonas sp.]